MDNAADPYDLITVLSRLGREIGQGHSVGPQLLGGQVFSEECLDCCGGGDLGLTVRHRIKSWPATRPPTTISTRG